VLLLSTQVWRAARHRIVAHRQIGTAAAILALVVIIIGYLTAIEGARSGWVGPRLPRNPEAARHFLFVPLGNLAWFATCLGLGLHKRSVPHVHKRLMVLAMLGGLLPPALARLPAAAEPILVLGFVVGPLVYERRRFGHIHPVFAWGIPALVTTIPVTVLVARSAAWDAAARWLMS